MEGSQLHQLSIKRNHHHHHRHPSYSFYSYNGKNNNKSRINNNNNNNHSDPITTNINNNRPNHDNSSNNNIQNLSYDLLCNIFMMLPFESLVKSIRVCRQWKEIILHSPLLWQQVVFINSKIPIRRNTIQHYLLRLQNASLLTFRIDKAFDGESLLLLLSNVNCHQLHTLGKKI